MLYSVTRPGLIAVLLAGTLCPALPVVAQPEELPATVTSRGRPDLDPSGVPLGGFTLFPELAVEYRDDDNVYATNENAVSDNSWVFRPALTLRSDWNRNSLSIGANAALNRYDLLTAEDHDDSEVFTRGRWDTANNGSFTADLTRSVNHEGRESADDARGFERTRFTTDATTLGYAVAPGRMLFEIEFDTATLDFDDVLGPNGPVNNDDRDRDRTSSRLRVGYQVFDGYALFFEARDSETDYDDRFDDNGFERSSQGNEYVIGAALNVTEIMFGSAFYGRKSQTYDDPRFAKIGGPAFGLDVGWNITELTTLTFSGREQVAATTIVGAAGIDETRIGLRADHELLRNLILSIDWMTGSDEFKGIPRQDDYRASSFGARYLMNRRLQIEFEYTSRDRDTNAAADLNFSKRTITIQFKGQI